MYTGNLSMLLENMHVGFNLIPTKKSLKILKGQSETVYRRRTDNTMGKIKSTKGQTTIDKAYI